MKRIAIFHIGMLLIAFSAFSIEPYSKDTTAFVNVNVIPMTGEAVLQNQTVIIENGVIDEIGPAESVKIPRRTTEIDASEKYLIPGLIDLHAHLFAGRKGNPQLLNLYLSQGVTSILNLRGGKGMLRLGEQIDSGEIIAPEIYQGSPIQGNISPTPATYKEGAAAVRQFKKEGYDFIKNYNYITAEGYRGIVETAAELNMPMIGHTVREVGFEGVLSAKQHFAHMEEIIYGAFRDELDESCIPEVTQKVKDAGVSVVATLTVFHNILRQLDDLEQVLSDPGVEHIPPVMADTWAPERNEYTNSPDLEKFENMVTPMYGFLQKLTAAFHDAGIPVLMGTDACVTGTVPGHSAHDELVELTNCGFSNYDALAAATSKAAIFLNANDLGTIQPGKRADLILLNANPLEDITNSRDIQGIMTRGLYHKQSDIQAELETYP